MITLCRNLASWLALYHWVHFHEFFSLLQILKEKIRNYLEGRYILYGIVSATKVFQLHASPAGLLKIENLISEGQV